MKMKSIKSCFGLLLATPLLASASSTSFKSEILGKSLSNIYVESVVADITSVNHCRTNSSDNSKNEAMEVTVDYEIYKMNHSLLNVKWANTYTIFYRVRVDVKNSVQYKGGLFNWFNKYANASLSRIKVDFDIPTTPDSFHEILDSNDLSTDVYEYSLTHESDNPYYSFCDNNYEGGYYGGIYWYEGTSSSSNNRNFYARKSKVSLNNDISYTYFFDFDVLKGTQEYENKLVYIFGSYSFASDIFPSDMTLGVEVQCGLGKEETTLLKDEESDKLLRGRVNKLLQENYVPIKCEYAYTVDWSQSYVLK